MRELGDADDATRFGGKAAQLALGIQHGLPIPGGFALDVETVEAVVRSARLEMPDGHWAVRSSALDEDSVGASFAGQHLSLLHVTAADVPGAVRSVWESGRSAAALAYREKMGIRTAPRMAIVIQRMVYPEVAGVLFTRHPVTGARERMIEASWGLGEVVVSGLVTPDSFRVAPTGQVLERRAGFKDVAIQHERGGGTREVEVEAHMHEALCLDDNKLGALHRLASDVERGYAGEHDIEWAFAAEVLYLLQRRAITTG